MIFLRIKFDQTALISHQPRCAILEVHPHCLPLLSQIPPWVKIHQNKLSKKRERKFVIQQQKKRTLWGSICDQTVVYNPSLAARQAFQVLQAILLCWHRVPSEYYFLIIIVIKSKQLSFGILSTIIQGPFNAARRVGDINEIEQSGPNFLHVQASIPYHMVINDQSP